MSAVEQAAAVLAVHMFRRPGVFRESECGCGWRVMHPDNTENGASRLRQQRLHIAEELAAAGLLADP